MSGWLDGSSTICAKITARAAASGLRAHQRCSVLGCPWRMDFSRAEAVLMAFSGRATSMSFLWFLMRGSLWEKGGQAPTPTDQATALRDQAQRRVAPFEPLRDTQDPRHSRPREIDPEAPPV